MKKKVILLGLFSTIFVCILLFVAGIIKLPNNNSEVNQVEKEATLEKALAIAELIGVDVSKYNVKSDSYHQGLFLNILPEEHVEYIFESPENNLTVSYSFIKGNLHSLTTNIGGRPQINRRMTNNFENAQNFLDKYQSFSGVSYYVEMLSMLKDVKPDEDITKTSGNIKLQVTQVRNITEIRWTYIEKDVEVPVKCVALYFEQGFLKYFVDKWNIYKIGSNKIVLSEQEAIDIAKNQAQDYTWSTRTNGEDTQVKLTEVNIVGVIETQLNFENYPETKEARSGDPFTLYPSWRVQLNLDEIYPSNVYGLDVRIWADTKEVYITQTMTKFGGS
jgi:hypothetical protein